MNGRDPRQGGEEWSVGKIQVIDAADPAASFYKPSPLGALALPIGRGIHVVRGGPYLAKPAGCFGVKLAAEIGVDCQVNLPARDFSVPASGATKAALKRTLQAMLDGQEVYVGCMGGRGRTGLFLALLAKACGFRNPVGYVRAAYCRSAVETEEQKRFVETFPVLGLRIWLWRKSMKRQGR